jgi:hypothetical protein
MTHALPIIQKEGTRYAKRELAKFLERQQGGGRR